MRTIFARADKRAANYDTLDKDDDVAKANQVRRCRLTL